MEPAMLRFRPLTLTFAAILLSSGLVLYATHCSSGDSFQEAIDDANEIYDPVDMRHPDGPEIERHKEAVAQWMERFHRGGYFTSFAVAVIVDDSIVYSNYINSDQHKTYPVASVTKTFTATTAQILIDKGILNPEEPVEQIFPGLRLERLSSRPILVDHLLTHTAGLPDLRYYKTYEPVSYNKLSFKLVKPIYPPGKHYRYSNHGYMLLGEIIEKKTGLTIEEAVKLHFLEPAGLTDTTGPKTGAGGLKTSIHDLARYASMWLSGGHIDGRQIVQPESILTMLRNPLYAPSSRNQFYTGRGWRVKTNEDGVVTFFHIGGADYVAAWVQMFPRYGTAICYLGNPPEYTPPLEMFLAEMQKKLGRLASAYVGAREPLYTWESEPAPPWVRDRVIGTYRNPLTGKIIEIREAGDGLRYRNSWGGGYYLYPFTTHVFRGGENWLTHDFVFDREGHLEGMANGDGFYVPYSRDSESAVDQGNSESQNTNSHASLD
ncbi:MAG TPA: hypothetical protein DEA96_01645 [Leptospiraceae bacterium]|nr:hypothetical protein [Spirochaetaceae bacterium]HBS03637.1 hypothetical protein [Leptospiraceae bacterium]|tara:strand:+ start:14630 stop:16099 length:1470 start_codon:yes stop_codon:yes gene_type:complete